jgi:uncharacterized protein
LGRIEHEIIHLVAIDGTKLKDIDGKWSQLSRVEANGAILVRPDGIVAWRSKAAEENGVDRFYAILGQILRV